jgi:V-type H+-transporting ATPase subunit a
MGFLRSEEMKYGVLVLPVQDARTYIDKLGGGSSSADKVNIQFEDMNAKDHRPRPYRKHVQRIDEMERILRYMNEEMKNVDFATQITKNKIDEFFAADQSIHNLDTIEAELKRLYQTFESLKDRNSNLQESYNKTKEEFEVVSVALEMMRSSGGSGGSGLEESLLGDDAGARILRETSGVVLEEDKEKLRIALWRASRGNVYMSFSPPFLAPDAKSGQMVKKSVFIVTFQGGDEKSNSLQDKVLKKCQQFGANLYSWPSNFSMAQSMSTDLKAKLAEQNKVLQAHRVFIEQEIRELISPVTRGGNSKIEDWRLFCVKEKAIYSVLNMCQEGMSLRVNIWYPSCEEQKIINLLRSHVSGSGDAAFLTPDKNLPAGMPPTFIRTNDFTAPWQEVVDTYGIPKYQEANPAVMTMVTFPFIFGMMYGDVGHGSLLLLFGLFLIMKADDFKFTQPVLYQIRYMIFSMGVFAVFAGFMYNDLFAMAMPLFSTRFKQPLSDDPVCSQCGTWTPNHEPVWQDPMGPYPFGLDWAWEGANNQLLFVNSMKMKLSVLFGVLQMLVGLLLRWSNAIYFRSATDLICECIPMMVFMVCFFGWMDWMIIYKWTHNIDNPPSIINSLICMAMSQEDKAPLWDGSTDVAKLFMKLTVLAVPIIMLPKPFILLLQHNMRQKKTKTAEGHEMLHDEEAAGGGHGHGHGDHFEFGEVFIHQIIETIEYTLGTVSHTASYLRIWALSLAHQQLSAVFFEKTLLMGLSMPFPTNGIALYILFTVWFGVTLGVLLGMDVLECFLHTLRLHWVEFQSKFYNTGGEGGVQFLPFDIRKLVEESDE